MGMYANYMAADIKLIEKLRNKFTESAMNALEFFDPE